MVFLPPRFVFQDTNLLPQEVGACVYIYITGEGIFFDKFLPSFFTDEIVLQLPAGHVQQTYGVN